jgi:hypothetical protein
MLSLLSMSVSLMYVDGQATISTVWTATSGSSTAGMDVNLADNSWAVGGSASLDIFIKKYDSAGNPLWTYSVSKQ